VPSWSEVVSRAIVLIWGDHGAVDPACAHLAISGRVSHKVISGDPAAGPG